MKRSVFHHIQIILYSTAAVLLLCLTVLLVCGDHVAVRSSRAENTVTHAQQVSKQALSDPQAPTGQVWEYQFALTDSIPHDTDLAFYVSHQLIDVYLDGVNVYSLRTEGTSGVKTTGSIWVLIPLYREDAGKTVRVILTPVYEDYGGRDVDFLIAPAEEIYKTQLQDSLPELLLCLSNIVVGILILGIALYLFIKKHGSAGIFVFGLLAAAVGLWRFTDTSLAALLLGRSSVLLYSISVSMLTAIVILLALSTKAQFQSNGRMLMDLVAFSAVVVFIVQLLLQILGVLDLRETLSITHGMIALCTLLIMGLSLYERFRYGRQKNHRTYTAWLLPLGALADLLMYYASASSSGLLFVQTAILCFVLLEGIRFLYNFTTQEQRLMEKDLQLIASRSITLMSQIRSHFVFNILNAISGMCKYDPEKADETVVQFARYLRSNIDVMQEDKAVTFHRALRHLEDYVALEQVRFGDKIRFETDLQVENFMLPPLILQPLVENAIKHGLTVKPSGGTITLRTSVEGDTIQITVADDGVGFDTGTPPRSGAVGLENVRFRLTHMAQGEMKIVSTPGKGTAVTLTIPRKENELCN